LIREIEIALVRGRAVLPIAPAPCSASKGGEPCGKATRHALSIAGRTIPCCLPDLAVAAQRGGIAFINGVSP
jgi:hypothetical protein